MHMALAAHRFFSEFSRCVDHRAKEEHSSFEFGSNLIAADVRHPADLRDVALAAHSRDHLPDVAHRPALEDE